MADNANSRNLGMNRRFSRGQFLRTAGVGAAAIGAASMGFGGVAHALPAGNPDPGHIKGPDNSSPALTGNAVMYVYPRNQGKPMPQTGEYRDAYNVQWAVDNVQDSGTVYLMTTDPDDNEIKQFDFNESTVKVLGKAITILGMAAGGVKPFISGTSPGISNQTQNSGIFHVESPGKAVEISNIAMRHHYDYMAYGERYGSGTVICSGSSNFRLSGCDIDTNTSSAVPLRTLSTTGQISITGCTIKGRSFKVGTADRGAFSCVNVGSFGMVDLKGSTFTVDNCDLDSAVFIGVAVFNFQSDNMTNYVVTNNRIGKRPTSANESTGLGIMFGFTSFPLGNIIVKGNDIQLNRFYTAAPISTGISIQSLNPNPANALSFEVSGNTVKMDHYSPSPPLPGLYFDPIAIEDIAPALTPLPKSFNVSGKIFGNTLLSATNGAKRGVTLGILNNQLLSGRTTGATGVQVYGNDYSGLAVSIAKVYLSQKSSANQVNEDSLTCAQILNQGTGNTVIAGGVNCP